MDKFSKGLLCFCRTGLNVCLAVLEHHNVGITIGQCFGADPLPELSMDDCFLGTKWDSFKTGFTV